MSTVLQSPYDVRDAWMAEGYGWHGLPAREAAKVPVKRAIGHRTRNDDAERVCLYSLPSGILGPRIRSCTGRCGSGGVAGGPM